MKQFRTAAGHFIGVLGFLILTMWLTGCETESHVFAPLPPRGGSATNRVTAQPIRTNDVFQIGDLVKITFSGPNITKPPHEEKVKGDGTITPPEIGPVVAAGKTPGQLQAELQTNYNRIYTQLTVTVQDSRLYWVVGDGNVNRPGPQPYLGETTVVQAISAAGGVTEFASNRMHITRAGSNKRISFNYKKAKAGDPKHNLYVYPGDTIIVSRSIL